MTDLLDRLSASRVVPVVTIDDADQAVPIARALLAGGIEAIEITLRTDAAYDAIRNVKAEVPEIALGIGTVIHVNQMEFCIDVRPDFIVTPGTTQELYEEIAPTGLMLIPGIATPTEAIEAMRRGYDVVKFFPAEAAGGVPMLKGIGGPIPNLRFMPTGGINTGNAKSYLDLPNVVCVGGSWVTKDPSPDAVEAAAKSASKL